MDRHLLQRGGLQSPKPTAKVGIQDVGGTQAAIDAGLKAIEAMLPKANESHRTTCPISELVMGVQCGGSDAFSGLSANPSVGYAADHLIRSGGTVILSEVPEFCGAEHLLAHRARDAKVGQRVYDLVDWYRHHAETVGAKLGENPSPGNIRGGLLNIAIKSLGAIIKGGTTRVEGTTDYATAPPRDDPSGGRGLWLMQGPGYDQESVPGQVGAGCTVVVFTTGRGTTIGNAITPVIKVASNSAIHGRMPNDIDLNAGTILDGLETRADVGKRIFDTVTRTASGVPSCAERSLHREFQIKPVVPTKSLPRLPWQALLPSRKAPASKPDGRPFPVVFINRTELPIRLFWMDRNGRPRAYGEIEAGGRMRQSTRPGAVWMIADREEANMGYFTVGDRAARAIIPR